MYTYNFSTSVKIKELNLRSRKRTTEELINIIYLIELQGCIEPRILEKPRV